MELRRIGLVLEFSRFHRVLQSTEVFLTEFSLMVRLETLIERRLLTLVVLRVDSGSSSLSERLAEQVL